MKKQTVVYCLLSIAYCLASCSSDQPVDASADRQMLISSIDSLQKKMFNQQSMEVDKDVASKEVALYQDFLTKFPQDSLSPE